MENKPSQIFWRKRLSDSKLKSQGVCDTQRAEGSRHPLRRVAAFARTWWFWVCDQSVESTPWRALLRAFACVHPK